MDIKNQTAIVTGGAIRVGRALALALAHAGVNVAIHYYKSDQDAEETLAALRAEGVRVAGIQGNLADPDAPRTLFAQAQAALGNIDILVNSAALFNKGGWQDTQVADWDEHFAVNLRAPFFLAQAFASALGTRSGHIINIADWRGARPGVGHLAYTYTKAGIIAMTYSLAQAMAPAVRVNAIAPGAILAPPEMGEEYLQKVAQDVPLKRHGSPNDVADAMLFLLRSDFVNGELLYVTGGQEL